MSFPAILGFSSVKKICSPGCAIGNTQLTAGTSKMNSMIVAPLKKSFHYIDHRITIAIVFMVCL